MDIDEFDFEWGVKKEVGVGHTDKDFQYYESFTYKGVKYTLYEYAYFYQSGHPTTHIGKLVKLYETPAHEKTVQVLWLFCPLEIRNFLVNVEPKWNELFLASGQGKGLSNINDVEAIVGKCQVVCTSKDKRNSQVSKDELEKAEYFFYRTFDVAKQTISEKFPDEIAGIKVEFLFNRIEDQNLNRPELQKLGEQVNESSRIEPSIGAGSPAKNVMPTSRKSSLLQDLEEGPSILSERRTASESRNFKRPPVESQNLNRPELQKPSEQVDVSSRNKPSIRADGPARNVMPTSRKSSLLQDVEEGASILSERRRASENQNMKRPPAESQNLNRPELQNPGEQANDSCRIKPSIGAGSPSKIVLPTSRKSSLLKDLEEGTSILGENRSFAIENLNMKRSPVESRNMNRPEIQKPREHVHVSSRLELSKGAGSQAKNVMPSSRKSSLLKDLEEGASVLSERRNFASDNLNLKRSPVERGTNPGREVKDMSKVRSLGDSFTENIEDAVPLKKRPNLVDGKNSISLKEGSVKIAKAMTASQGPGARHAPDRSLKASKKITEVTRRPDAERRNWFKQLPWEERLQKAQEAGTLVLLENLDPSFSSFEVEDLVWHALDEKVAARMIQSSTFSSPLYGKAFVIFKSKLAAEAAISKLTGKCLILSDGRPVIGRRRNLRVSNKETSFFGHLVIDKLKVQRQSYDVRTAVSTAHCSQPNTLEYEMAIQWLELQEKSQLCWKALHKVQWKEITELKSRLKLNRNG